MQVRGSKYGRLFTFAAHDQPLPEHKPSRGDAVAIGSDVQLPTSGVHCFRQRFKFLWFKCNVVKISPDVAIDRMKLRQFASKNVDGSSGSMPLTLHPNPSCSSRYQKCFWHCRHNTVQVPEWGESTQTWSSILCMHSKAARRKPRGTVE
ncbi:hypothetical protein TNIN_61001 [Trichonephila inaurata madagascariensis]|uniref:Uncharacterized protein n=1 Tax=Trichonephila inaurata madagascariensis TaxID=2747483 RepID=A0A8X7CSP4_9ARAC|nr:hypothetical protein TNIN_61001 [Trichonephila inaurata madagascariensis]